ncbi:MAG: phosphopantetheine-binding protein, partial [Mycobacterium sp.]
ADSDKARMSRLGLAPLSTEQALRLFDTAMLADRPVLAAARLDATGLSASGVVPPLLRELATRSGRRLVADTDNAVSKSGLAARLQGLSPEQRHTLLVELVCTNAATVLGRSSADIEADVAFQDLGFDSLSAVELRNRLKTATGLSLSPTLIFDYPTPAALAAHLDTQLEVTTNGADRPNLMARFDDIARELRTLVNQLHWTPDDKTHFSDRIQTILIDLTTAPPVLDPSHDFDDDIATASESQLFAILDEDVGS